MNLPLDYFVALALALPAAIATHVKCFFNLFFYIPDSECSVSRFGQQGVEARSTATTLENNDLIG